MEFGFPLPTRGPLANPRDIRRLARRGEELGYGFVSLSDHIVIPRRIDSDYPYDRGGTYPGELFGSSEAEYLEQLTVAAFVAACTSKIELLTSVMVVPYRAPLHAAKAISTIDVLSGGRVILGVGAGWMREEFEALGAPPFERRGAVTEEYLRAFRELWTADSPRMRGEWVGFSDIVFEPRPARRPHPPVWMGGESEAALRRAARLADGWYPFAHPRAPAIGSLAALRRSLRRLGELMEEAGRDPAAMTVALDAEMLFDPDREVREEDGSRRIFTGGPQAIAGDIGAFAEEGVSHIQVLFRGDTVAQVTGGMERFAEDHVR